MTVKSRLRKLALTIHVVTSVGWLGALFVFLAFALSGVTSQDTETIRAAAAAMALSARYVILPLCLAAVATGMVQACAVTEWGLFRHYWVLFKFLLTLIAIAVLLLKLGPIGELAAAASRITFTPADHLGLRISLLIHAAGGLAILLAATVLAIYKPGGMTPHGLRERRQRAGITAVSGASIPPWVKIAGVLTLALILLTVAMLLAGGHGPEVHYPRG